MKGGDAHATVLITLKLHPGSEDDYRVWQETRPSRPIQHFEPEFRINVQRSQPFAMIDWAKVFGRCHGHQ